MMLWKRNLISNMAILSIYVKFQGGWFIMEPLFKMVDLGVPLFLETPIWISCK